MIIMGYTPMSEHLKSRPRPPASPAPPPPRYVVPETPKPEQEPQSNTGLGLLVGLVTFGLLDS